MSKLLLPGKLCQVGKHFYFDNYASLARCYQFYCEVRRYFVSSPRVYEKVFFYCMIAIKVEPLEREKPIKESEREFMLSRA